MTTHLDRRTVISTLVLASLIGCSRSAKAATIDGRTFQGDGTGEGLRAQSDLTIRNSRFLNLGNGGIRVNVATDGLVVEQIEARNLYRFLENTASDRSKPASLTNFKLRGITGDDIRRAMTRIRYRSRDGLIEDVIARAGENTERYCTGFVLDDEARAIIYRRCEAHGFAERGRSSSDYWNGDGFSDERGNTAIQYLNCIATGSTDGGFDLKSTDVRLTNCVAKDNKRNFRFWGDGEVENCRSEDPRSRGGSGRPSHFSFHGSSTRYVIDRPIVRSSSGNDAPVFLFDNDTPANIEIRNADIDAPGAPLFRVENSEPNITWVPAREDQNIKTAE
ncbi:hypothetical protein [Parasphingorhabdus cellanae]|uniref:Right handed beta helix domain-containing protein n=1 Tax=Parasphingorhabdus cellanae TaxID=2806553 RepID=A0ABX7T2C1_9SPHN|nr:hypothetical protein [Parasphingorhabdus cellanae]QTD55301.1 hypothetical protein J4G78_13915 [Parasphingorhabdus cellanae]